MIPLSLAYTTQRTNDMPNYLCLSIDGLQSGMIGAYGNSWIQTPTFDSLACQSALFDRFYASSMDLATTFTELWHFPADCRKILLTDSTDVFLHEQASLFDEKHRLESKTQNRVAGKAEETQFFRNMATIVDLLKERDNEPFLFWAHFEGFRGRWDFPLSYRKHYQIDEDPNPYSGLAVPEIVGKHIDPDVRQSVTESYSGGVSLLDETLSGLLAFLHKDGLIRNTVLLFMSVRGFSLGEHNRIGCNDELYSENTHLPLFIRFPDGSLAGFRSQTLLQPVDVWKFLVQNELPDEPAAVHPFLRIGKAVIVTPDWFVYQKPLGQKPSEVELYVKPDDRWETNDVSVRCPHVLESLIQKTKSH